MPRALAAFAAATLLTAGCGYIGGPMAPLANVPSRVTGLAAVERGSRLIVQFTVPRLTTEGIAIRQPLKLDLRIGTAGSPFNAEEWAAHARQVSAGSIDNGIARYEIPTAEWIGKEVAIAVRAIGANGKESGWSNYAVTPVVAPPETPANVAATATAGGVRLTWRGAGDRFRVFRRGAGAENFAPVATVEQHAWTDPDAGFGKEYGYLIQAIVGLGDNREAESEPSGPVVITPVDKFPPAAPAGLRAAAAPSSIELAWDRDSEPDLAGYRVYRASSGGEFAKLADVSQVPSYSDRGAEHAKTYRYAVTAVDQSGNESPRSPLVEVTLP